MTPYATVLSPAHLAWAAGLIDGEGCIGIYPFKTYNKKAKQKVNYTLSLCVRMTHEPTIQRIKSIFSVGSVSHAVSKNPNHRPTWGWFVYSQQALFVIEQIAPYLVTKADQANLALEFRAHTYARGRELPHEEQEWRKTLADKMCQLKRL